MNSWRKFQGHYYPSSFTYVRYTDVIQRLKQEKLIPIVVCKGKLVSIHGGGEERVLDFMSPGLDVQDHRPRRDLYGYPARYSVTNKMWPRQGSTEYAVMVGTNKLIIEEHLKEQAP